MATGDVIISRAKDDRSGPTCGCGPCANHDETMEVVVSGITDCFGSYDTFDIDGTYTLTYDPVQGNWSTLGGSWSGAGLSGQFYISASCNIFSVGALIKTRNIDGTVMFQGDSSDIHSGIVVTNIYDCPSPVGGGSATITW